MSSKNDVHFFDSDDARQSARRLVSAQLTARTTHEALPRFASHVVSARQSATSAAPHMPIAASWAAFLEDTARRWSARAAFISNQEGLLISTFGDMATEQLEAASARFSLALDQAAKTSETNQTGALIQRSAGESVWMCLSIPCAVGSFFVGCLLATPTATPWIGTALETEMSRQVRALSGEDM